MVVLEIVYLHTFRILILLGFLGTLAVLGILAGRWARGFKKIVENLPADHKLVSQSIAAIDVGNFLFLYRVYEKNRSVMSLPSKSYISLEVGIPFSPSDRESIELDINNLIIALKEEGGLTGYSPILENEANTDEEDEIKSTWLGLPLRLEFLQRKMTPSKMAEIQGRIIRVVDKYQLQDVSWCIIRGKEYGTEYRYHKGNLLQSTVVSTNTFNRSHLDYKAIASLQTGEFDNQFSPERFFELYETSARNLGKADFHFGDVEELTIRLFKDKKNRVTRIEVNSNDISVNVTIPKKRAASSYHLVHSKDRWWVFAEGGLDVINPISTDDESSACDLFLRILQQVAETE